MFCEAICKYRVRAKNLNPLSIGSIYAVAANAPEQTAGFLLTEHGKFLEFPYIREGKDCQGFIGYKEGRENCVFKLIRTKDTIRTALLLGNQRCRVRRLNGIYPTSELRIQNGRLFGITRVPNLSINDVFNDLQLNRNPRISYKDSIFFDNSLNSPQDIPTLYHIIARDGEIKVSADLLISPSPHSSRSKGFTTASECVVTVCDAMETFRDELCNKEDYLYLVRAFLKDIPICGHSFITHALIKSQKPLYFTFFVVQDQKDTEITVFVTRELFSMVNLYNMLGDNKVTMAALLKVPYFVNNDLSLVYQNSMILQKYKIKPYKVKYLLKKATEGENLVIKGSKTFFWVMTYIMETMYPVSWPGLVLSPLNDEMAYLLTGPYNFVVGYDGSFEKYKYKSPPVCECDADNMLYRDSDDIHEELDPPFSYLIGKNNRKEKYLQNIRRLKVRMPHTFPLAFPENLTNLERAFFEQPLYHKVKLLYSLNREIIIFPRAYIYEEDPLALWLVIFPGDLDYNVLLREKWDNIVYGYMIRRACMDRDTENLKKILDVLERAKIMLTDEIIRHIADYPHKPKQNLPDIEKFAECVVINFCECVKQPALPIAKEPVAFCEEIQVSYENQVCGKSGCMNTTVLFSNGKLFRLTTIETILGCYESEYYSDEVILNILVYFKVYNLPVKDSAQPSTSDLKFDVA